MGVDVDYEARGWPQENVKKEWGWADRLTLGLTKCALRCLFF